MSFWAVIIIGLLVVGGVYLMDRPMFDSWMSKFKVKSDAPAANTTIEEQTPITNRTMNVHYIGKPITEIECRTDGHCAMYGIGVKCDAATGQCYTLN